MSAKDKAVEVLGKMGAALREALTKAAASGAEKAVKAPWPAAVILLLSHVAAFLVGAVFF